tara:strand:- start:380 stop:577 length:198 start_codon:yes stop_codon:yes gene_type:complete
MVETIRKEILNESVMLEIVTLDETILLGVISTVVPESPETTVIACKSMDLTVQAFEAIKKAALWY